MDRSRLNHEARLPAGAAVDLAALAAVADEHAAEVFGDTVARGEPFPVVDASDTVAAYVFPYALGVASFPPDDALDRHPDPERFGAVYVSAAPARHPVLRVVHGLHPVLRRSREAEQVGRTALDADDAALTHIYWLGLHQEFFDVQGAGRQMLLDMGSLRQVDREVALRPAARRLAEAERPSARDLHLDTAVLRPVLRAPSATDLTGAAAGPCLVLVPRPECVPAVDWTYWCVPTAWTMAVCYYDNYVKGVGGTLGYGRLVGHWFDHQKSGNNVPDYIDQLIDPTSGPPPTWRQGFQGFTDFVQKTYGYTFQSRKVTASAANDWAWADITAEIDAGRPFVWGTDLPAGGHAVCALGYRVASDGSRRVVVNTTWGDTTAQQREEWAPSLGTSLDTIVPGGGTAGQHLVLWAPDGGETLISGIATTVSWHVWGDAITTAQVDYSLDGGNSWSAVRQAAPCSPGWNQCDWTPPAATARARVRIRGMDAAGHYVAGDGSQTDVAVLPGPRQVRLETFLVSTTTDAAGRFSAPHGLGRFTPDGYTIRAIVVSVQHRNGNWHTLELSNSVDNRFWWNDQQVSGVIDSGDFHERPVQVVLLAEHVVG